MIDQTRFLEEIMKSLRYALVLPLTVAAFLFAGAAAKGDPLTITLSNPFQSGDADVFAFDGTITNDSNHTVNLDGIDVNVGSPLVGDDSACNNNCPLTLAAGASYTGLLFDVDVPAGTPFGLYAGDFDITGEFGGVVGSESFDVNVTPEPASYLLLGTGLVALGFLVRRRMKSGRALTAH
jgi:hypothetical protein